PDPDGAATEGARLVESLAAKAGMPCWPLVRLEAVREDVLDEEIGRPTLPDLVSVPEAAEILGVSPQRVHELAASGNREFPEPVYDLKAGKLWLRHAMEAYAEARDRKPGRPDRGALLRERAASALLDAGLTLFDTRIFLGHDRIPILQLAAQGARP